MEAWYENDWHLYDPDLELILFLANGAVLSLDELVKSPESVSAYYQGRGSEEYIQHIVDIISTREDNSFTSYPRLALFEWKTNVLFYVEKAENILKWLIPTIFLLLGFWLYPEKKRKTCVA